MNEDKIIFTKAFWVATLTRSVRTFAQGMVGAIGTGTIGITDINFPQAISIGAGAAIVSILMALAWPNGVPEGKTDDE